MPRRGHRRALEPCLERYKLASFDVGSAWLVKQAPGSVFITAPNPKRRRATAQYRVNSRCTAGALHSKDTVGSLVHHKLSRVRLLLLLEVPIGRSDLYKSNALAALRLSAFL